MAPKPKKRRRTGNSSDELPERATYPGHVERSIFCHDATEAGPARRSRPTSCSFTADATVEVLNGSPTSTVTALVRMETGRAHRPGPLRGGASVPRSPPPHRAGLPLPDPLIESFNARFRDEVLDCELVRSILEAACDRRRDTSNRYHPHSSLGMPAPAVFAERWRADHMEGVARADRRPAGYGGRRPMTPGSRD